MKETSSASHAKPRVHEYNRSISDEVAVVYFGDHHG